MRLFHGSTLEVATPDVAHSHRHLDFGPGFYLTSFEAQATRWAHRKSLRRGSAAIVNVYEFAADLAGFRALTFGPGDDRAWVEFVCHCRRGGTGYQDYDVVSGPVADDRVYAAVDMYVRGLWDMERTLAALRYYGRNDQYCVLSQRLLDEQLSFLSSYEVAP